MKNQSRRSFFLGITFMSLTMLAGAFFAGCVKGPLSPRANVMVKSVTPNPLGPSSVSGTAEITIPAAEISLESRNGVPATATQYTVKYVGSTGAELSESYRRTGYLNEYLDGENAASFKIEIFTSDFYLELTDDQMPLSAVIEISGRDDNENPWTATGQVPLTKTSGL